MPSANPVLARLSPFVLVAGVLLASPWAHAKEEVGKVVPADKTEPAAGSTPASPRPPRCVVDELAVPKARPAEHPAILRRARTAVEELRNGDALRLLASIGQTNDALVRIQALEIEAMVHLLEGRSSVAQPLLKELYFQAPAFLLNDPSLPPRVTKMFAEEAARPHERAVRVALLPRGPDRRAFALTAGGATVQVHVACKNAKGGPLLPVATKRVGAGARFRLPSLGRFRCHATALDADGLPLGRFGSPGALNAIASRPAPAPISPEPAFYSSWWFWTLTAGVVTGGVVATVVGVSGRQDVPDSDLTVELAPAGAATILRW